MEDGVNATQSGEDAMMGLVGYDVNDLLHHCKSLADVGASRAHAMPDFLPD